MTLLKFDLPRAS